MMLKINEEFSTHPILEGSSLGKVRCLECSVFLGRGFPAAHGLIPPCFREVDVHSLDTLESLCKGFPHQLEDACQTRASWGNIGIAH